MRWTNQEEQSLINLAKDNSSLEQIAAALNRSPEAIFMKLKRLGLQAPENYSVKKTDNKVTKTTTTTTTQKLKLEMVMPDELPSPMEALGLLWAALQKLREPDVTKEESKRLRLIIQGVKSYLYLNCNYVVPTRKMESHMLTQAKLVAARFKIEVDGASTPEKKAEYKDYLRQAEQLVKEMEDEDARVKFPDKLTE